MMYGLNLDYYQSYRGIEIEETDIIMDQQFAQVLREKQRLNPSEGAFMFHASLYIKEPENYLFFEHGLPSILDLCNEFDIKKTKLYEVLKSLEEKDYIRTVYDEKNNRFIYINPNLHFKRHISINTYKLFQNKPNSRNVKISSLTEQIRNKEALLQDYLKDNLNLIEEGLLLINTEHKLEDGRIDILAKDHTGKICIIELKVIDNDEKLVFQSVYYPTLFDEEVRMITVAPNYVNKIYDSLNSLKYVEMKQYEIINDNLIITNYKK
jgi:DNA-binding MarR family transcriptional regulator